MTSPDTVAGSRLLAQWVRESYFGIRQVSLVSLELDSSAKLLFSGAKCHREKVKSGIPRSRSLSSVADGRISLEELWRQFFSDPGQWWDHTTDKVNSKYPDFKHKNTGAGLWLDKRANPSWVKKKLTSMTPGSVSRSHYAWNAMLSKCVKSDRGKDALELYNQMQTEAVKPDKFIFATILNACASLAALDQGRRVHAQVRESGCESDLCVSNSLVDMYAKCGSLADAQRVFRAMPVRDVVSWSAMLAGYVNCEEEQKALKLFRQMQASEVKANSVTFVLVLKACASTMALVEGRRIHEQIIQSGCESDVYVGSGLVDMYCKCGSLSDAEKVFRGMPTRNVVSWCAMLGGFAMHGLAKESLQLFQEMNEAGVKLDRVTFICLLSACSHGGLVDEGIHFFETMDSVYSVSPTVEHYICMVDLLGRAGRLDEAELFLRREPIISKNSVALRALLGACRNHRNVEMGERIAQLVLELKPDDTAGYVLLSNIYVAAGQRGSSDKIQELRKGRGVKKLPGRTWIEVNTKVHSFVADDKDHPRIEEIHAELKRLYGQMNRAGCVADIQFVQHDVQEEEKVFPFCPHSEKLAIAFGIISTAPGTQLRIYKNLRVCVDCHTATKFIAKIECREIIVRDANRFHHFKDGLCSCKDYW